MSLTIYDPKTLHIHDTASTRAAAALKIKALARKNKVGVAVDTNYFNTHIDHDVVVINLTSGKPCTIKASQRGGCCDPSNETYHSM